MSSDGGGSGGRGIDGRWREDDKLIQYCEHVARLMKYVWLSVGKLSLICIQLGGSDKWRIDITAVQTALEKRCTR